MRNRGIHGKHPEQMERRDTAEAASDTYGLDDRGRSAGQHVVVAPRSNEET